MDNRNAHYRTSATAIAMAALLIVGVVAALPLANRNASAQTVVSITTSADSHGNRFFGTSLVEVRIQDPALAADSAESKDVPITINAFGSTQSIKGNETSGSSGTLLLYLKVDPDRTNANLPVRPATPLSSVRELILIGNGSPHGDYTTNNPRVQQVDVAANSIVEGGAITISYGGISKTLTYDDSDAQITLDRAAYGQQNKMFVTVYDPDLNLDPTAANIYDQAASRILVTGSDLTGLTGEWRETGTNTARFEKELTVSNLPAGVETISRSIAANDYANVTTRASVPQVTNATNPTITVDTSYVVQIVRGTIQPLGTVTYSSELSVVVSDPGRQNSSRVQETVSGVLQVGSGNNFNMKEQSANSDNWVPNYSQDKIKLTFKEDTNLPAGILKVLPGTDVTIRYTDNQPASETSTRTFKITNTNPTMTSDKGTVGFASSIKLTMTDPELNDDSGIIESYTVTFSGGGNTASTSAAIGAGGTSPFKLKIERNASPIALNNAFAVTFTETSANSGIFEATVRLDTLRDAATSAFSLSDGDQLKFEVEDSLSDSSVKPKASVTVRVGLEKPTIEADRSTLGVPRLASADVISGENGVSNLGGQFFTIKITDPAANTNSLSEQTLQVAQVIGSDNILSTSSRAVFFLASNSIVITATPPRSNAFSDSNMDALELNVTSAIRETGLDTGVFEGTIQVMANADLPAWNGMKLKIEYLGRDTSYDTATMRSTSTSDDASPITLTFTARNAILSTDTSVVANGQSLTITVRDDDANRDSETTETVKVFVEWTGFDNAGNTVTRTGWVELDETGDNTGVFNETLDVGSDTIGGNAFRVAADTDVELTYYDLTPNTSTSTWPTSGSSIQHEKTLTVGSASGSLTVNAERAGPASKVVVTILDRDLNRDPNREESVSSDRITVFTDRGVSTSMAAEETDLNSGKFEGEITLRPIARDQIDNPPTTAGDGTTQLIIDVLPGDIVSIRYEDEKDENGRRTIFAKTFEVTSVDPDITTDKNVYSAGETMTITIADLDADEDADSNDIKTIQVYSTTDPIGRTNVQLIETGPSTGVFSGTVPLSSTFSTGSLTVRNGDIITVKYTDRFPADYKTRIEQGGQTSKDFVRTVQVGTSASTKTTTPSAPTMKDGQGRPLTQVLAGNQVVLSTTIKNNEAASTPYATLIQVKDSNNRVVYLNWQTGTLPADGEIGVGLSWTPEQPGRYTVEVFVLSNLTTPQILSDTVRSTVNVS